jgi:conjugal transfer/entry exclusion protein
MSKKNMRRGLLSAALAVGTLGSGSASAAIGVFDAANYSANAVTAGSTAWTAAHTTWIFWSLNKNTKGSMLYSTQNIDNSTKNIDSSTKNIDITTTHIDESVTNIEEITNSNYEINKTFIDIVNNYYGTGDGGIIPTSIDKDVAKLLGSGHVGDYTSNYKDASYYAQGNLASGDNLTNVGMEASKNQKIANDALVKTLSSHSESIKQQEEGLRKLVEDANQAQGHGYQLQYANAIAGVQTAQLMQVREIMLASENARAAAAQADADRKSRQVATSQSLRAGLAGGDGIVNVIGTGLGKGATGDGKTFD